MRILLLVVAIALPGVGGRLGLAPVGATIGAES